MYIKQTINTSKQAEIDFIEACVQCRKRIKVAIEYINRKAVLKLENIGKNSPFLESNGFLC